MFLPFAPCKSSDKSAYDSQTLRLSLVSSQNLVLYENDSANPGFHLQTAFRDFNLVQDLFYIH